MERNGKIVKGKGFITDDLTNQGIEFIKKMPITHFSFICPTILHIALCKCQEGIGINSKIKTLIQKRTVEIRSNDKESGINNKGDAHTKAALAMCENIDWKMLED